MSLYEYVSREFPKFRETLGDSPGWYKQEMNYGVAHFLVDFVVELLDRGEVAEVRRLMQLVENGMDEREHISTALCLDFVQPVAELDEVLRSQLVPVFGPKSKSCYDSR